MLDRPINDDRRAVPAGSPAKSITLLACESECVLQSTGISYNRRRTSRYVSTSMQRTTVEGAIPVTGSAHSRTRTRACLFRFFRYHRKNLLSNDVFSRATLVDTTRLRLLMRAGARRRLYSYTRVSSTRARNRRAHVRGIRTYAYIHTGETCNGVHAHEHQSEI